MAGAASRRSTLTLYSLCNCCHCHRVRLVLLEKGLDAEFVWVNPASPPPDLLDASPGGHLPTLIDRDVVLNNDRVIIEYLDERYPHPPLLATDPAGRARQRLALARIEQDLYTQLPRLSRSVREERDLAREALRTQLVAGAAVFAARPYFLGTDYSLIDATLAPLLWRLAHYGIELPSEAAPVSDYAARMFARPAFRQSLSAVELEMRDDGPAARPPSSETAR